MTNAKPAQPNPLQKHIDIAHPKHQRTVRRYVETALISLTHRINGKDRDQALFLAVGAGNKGNDILNDILDYVFNIKKAILNDPAQGEKMYENVKEYTIQRVDKSFTDAIIKAGQKARVLQ